MQMELEKSDMYLFVKLFCPKLYNKYVRVVSSTEKDNIT
jgi:hypothetical protein